MNIPTLKIEHTTDRELIVTGMPSTTDGLNNLPTALTLKVTYAGDSSALKAIQLDNRLLPFLAAAAELRDTLAACVGALEAAASDGEPCYLPLAEIQAARALLKRLE